MDLELKRWRQLANTPLHTHPQIKTQPKNYRPKTSVYHTDPIKSQRESPRLRTPGWKKKETLSKVLDTLVETQKDEIYTLIKGYLSPQDKQLRALQSASNTSLKKNLITPDDDDDVKIWATSGPTSSSSTTPKIPDNIFSLIEQFDDIRQRSAVSTEATLRQVTTSDTTRKKTPKPLNFPSKLVYETPIDRYTALKKLDRKLVLYPFSDGRIQGDNEKIQKLEELTMYLKTELENLDINNQDYHFRRLHVFQTLFNKLIHEFKTFGPIMAKIKKEYDSIIFGIQNDDATLHDLRKKVKSLMAQGENKVLLTYERRRGKQLQDRLIKLTQENHDMKREFERKLQVFSSYLPSLGGRPRSSHTTTNSGEGEKVVEEAPTYELGEDPLSQYEKRISTLEEKLKETVSQYDNLKRIQEEDYVEKALKDQIEFAFNDAKYKLNIVEQENAKLESELEEKSKQLGTVHLQLSERENEYSFLIKEYNKLVQEDAQKSL